MRVTVPTVLITCGQDEVHGTHARGMVDLNIYLVGWSRSVVVPYVSTVLVTKGLPDLFK